MDFNEKVVWVTGASSGIGEALAYELSQQNAKLILSARNTEKLEAVKAQCENSDSHLILPLDLTQTDSIPQAVKQAIHHFSTIDILVNCAGISQRSLAQDTRLEVDRRIMELNYFGTVALTKAVLPFMLERQAGHLVVISSLVGKFATPLRSTYVASKHALHGFFDSLRAEVADSGISVTLICPGFVKTHVSCHALQGDGTQYGKMDEAQENGMSAEQCAKEIIRTITHGKDEVYIGGKEKIGVYIQRFSPSLFNRIIRKMKVT